MSLRNWMILEVPKTHLSNKYKITRWSRWSINVKTLTNVVNISITEYKDTLFFNVGIYILHVGLPT